jgi:hypothetical protein
MPSVGKMQSYWANGTRKYRQPLKTNVILEGEISKIILLP